MRYDNMIKLVASSSRIVIYVYDYNENRVSDSKFSV